MRANAELPTYKDEECYCAIMQCDILRHPVYINGDKRRHYELKTLHENYITKKNTLICPATRQDVKTIELDLDLKTHIQQKYGDDDSRVFENYETKPLLESLHNAIEAKAQKKITLYHTSRFITFLVNRTSQDRNRFLTVIALASIYASWDNPENLLIAAALFMLIAGCVKYNDYFSNHPTPGLNNR